MVIETSCLFSDLPDHGQFLFRHESHDFRLHLSPSEPVPLDTLKRELSYYRDVGQLASREFPDVAVPVLDGRGA